MAQLRSKAGFVTHNDGCAHNARFYFGADEDEPPNRGELDPERHTTWVEADGTVGIRRGTAVSIGASAAYSANYDSLDWGFQSAQSQNNDRETYN